MIEFLLPILDLRSIIDCLFAMEEVVEDDIEDSKAAAVEGNKEYAVVVDCLGFSCDDVVVELISLNGFIQLISFSIESSSSAKFLHSL